MAPATINPSASDPSITANATNTTTNSTTPNIALIAGVSGGALVLFLGISGLVWWYISHRRRTNRESQTVTQSYLEPFQYEEKILDHKTCSRMDRKSRNPSLKAESLGHKRVDSDSSKPLLYGGGHTPRASRITVHDRHSSGSLEYSSDSDVEEQVKGIRASISRVSGDLGGMTGSNHSRTSIFAPGPDSSFAPLPVVQARRSPSGPLITLYNPHERNSYPPAPPATLAPPVLPVITFKPSLSVLIPSPSPSPQPSFVPNDQDISRANTPESFGGTLTSTQRELFAANLALLQPTPKAPSQFLEPHTQAPHFVSRSPSPYSNSDGFTSSSTSGRSSPTLSIPTLRELETYGVRDSACVVSPEADAADDSTMARVRAAFHPETPTESVESPYSAYSQPSGEWPGLSPKKKLGDHDIGVVSQHYPVQEEGEKRKSSREYPAPFYLPTPDASPRSSAMLSRIRSPPISFHGALPQILPRIDTSGKLSPSPSVRVSRLLRARASRVVGLARTDTTSSRLERDGSIRSIESVSTVVGRRSTRRQPRRITKGKGKSREERSTSDGAAKTTRALPPTPPQVLSSLTGGVAGSPPPPPPSSFKQLPPTLDWGY